MAKRGTTPAPTDAGTQPGQPVPPQPVTAQAVTAPAAARTSHANAAVVEEKKLKRYINDPSHPRMVLAQDRREKCLKMRIAGLSERAIAARLGVSATQVSRMLRIALDLLNKSELNKAEYLRRTELERLDQMTLGLMPHHRDPRYVDSMLRVMERRAAYLGIDAPTRSEIVQRSLVEEDFPDLDALPDEDLDTIERLLDKAKALNAAKKQGVPDAQT